MKSFPLKTLQYAVSLLVGKNPCPPTYTQPFPQVWSEFKSAITYSLSIRCDVLQKQYVSRMRSVASVTQQAHAHVLCIPPHLPAAAPAAILLPET